MDELKLCPVPWCERVNKPEFYNPEPKAYCVACPDCGLETNVFATEAEAIAAWNTRAEASSAEPVAWMYEGPECLRKVMQFRQSKAYMRAETETPLYAHPPAVPDTVNRALVEHMRETIREWERDEPRDDWWLHQHDHAAAADLIETQAREIERLRGVMREVFEEWAGSEGFIPETAPEAYLLQLTKRMADIASATLAGDSHD